MTPTYTLRHDRVPLTPEDGAILIRLPMNNMVMQEWIAHYRANEMYALVLDRCANRTNHPLRRIAKC